MLVRVDSRERARQACQNRRVRHERRARPTLPPTPGGRPANTTQKTGPSSGSLHNERCEAPETLHGRAQGPQSHAARPDAVLVPPRERQRGPRARLPVSTRKTETRGLKELHQCTQIRETRPPQPDAVKSAGGNAPRGSSPRSVTPGRLDATLKEARASPRLSPGKVFLACFSESFPIGCQLQQAGYGVIFLHKDLWDLRVTMRVLGWMTTNAVWGFRISPSSVWPDDFSMASRISRQLLMVAAPSDLPASETSSNHHFAVAESRKCTQLGNWPLTVCDHSQRRRVCVRWIHCGRPDCESLQCRSRRGICDFSRRRHTRTTEKQRIVCQVCCWFSSAVYHVDCCGALDSAFQYTLGVGCVEGTLRRSPARILVRRVSSADRTPSIA